MVKGSQGTVEVRWNPGEDLQNLIGADSGADNPGIPRPQTAH